MENNSVTDDNNSEEQQNLSEGAESSVRPSLSQVKKSWGFRRTTIARREFMEEVGDLTHSPPPARRGRNRRNNQTPQAAPETRDSQSATRTTRSVIDDLEWSAPSSPVSEESKAPSEASAGGSLDPSLWQDFGSAFHTAFSLLGGNEGLSMEMPDSLVAPDILEATSAIEAPPPQDQTEVPNNMESPDDMEVSLPAATDSVARGENDDVVLISSQEEDSDEMTLIQIKEQLTSKARLGDTRARAGKGGRGKARGRGRGRGRGKGKGRGRGRGRCRTVELQSSIGGDVEDSDDEVVLVNPAEQQLQPLQEEEKINNPHSPPDIDLSPAPSVSLSPTQQPSSDCIIIDSIVDQTTDVTPGQYDDAPEEEEEAKRDNMNAAEHSGISDSEGYNPNALYCICRQKHNKRFMICCDSCQEWFHGNCVGISKTQGRKMERNGQEYICPPCTTKKQSQLQPEPRSQAEPELSFPDCSTLSPSGEEREGYKEQQTLKETVVVVEDEVEKEAPEMRPESEPEAEMATDSSLPLCIGPGCSKQALPDSVYCGTDCIIQHAAAAMKTLSGPKVPKSRGRAQRKPPTAKPTTKGQRSSRMSKRLAGKAEAEGEEEEMNEDDGGQKEAASPLTCDPNLTDAQATSIPSSYFYTASIKDSKLAEAVNSSKQSPDDISTDAAPSSQSAAEAAPPQSHAQEKPKEPISSVVSKQQSTESHPCIPPNPTKSSQSPVTQSPSTLAPRHHETGALMVTKTTYVIPKKQSVTQSPSSHVSASTSCQKPPSAPTLLNETRNLPVPPAPSAPSSRPSQPSNQVRQSIQRSLTGILFKRVCDCDDLEMSESEVAKLVASIEMEMFDIFRNTDSKYMNKYRTIMFNLKDPRNKGLLYRVVRGEISPFRLARMSQKDMQATKASEPVAKETTEVKDAGAKTTSLLQKPEAVKVDLPSLNLARPDRSTEQKKSVPAPITAPAPVPAPKTRASHPSQSRAVPDILTCMFKDTTSEHNSHLFDLKCKICTGQMLAGNEEEPAKKKPKVSETRDKYEPPWRKSAGEDSPLRAPPDSPDMDSPTSPLIDPSSHLIFDSPVLTIVESPASPIMDSPASPTLESPASPVMESPASPTPDTPKATTIRRAYTPVVIPAVSTVTITRRDPRTAANRFSASSCGTSGLSNTTLNQSAPYAPLKETSSAPPSAQAPSLPATKTLPKSILMKPSSSADPRLYGTSSRTVITESPADGETAQFLAKQDIVWKGFLNMLTVAKFVTKGYLVSGSAENLKADLPDTIQIGGRIMPETVWDYVAKLKTSVTKELCVIRFHPATEEEEVAYVSLFSYFSSRGRFGVVANSSRSIKDLYLVPLSAKESIPSILEPLDGPGLEKNRPNLLLGLAIIQRAKRPGSLPQESEEKRPKVHMSKDPMWIPKPPVLYGSDKLEIFQPYDPETPANTTPPGSPSCPGSPSESSSSSSVTIPSLLTSIRANPHVSASSIIAATQTTTDSISDKNPTKASSDKTPLQTILKSLFGTNQTDSMDSSEGVSTATVGVKKLPAFSQVSGSMVDPIVQQYGQKSKVKEIEEEENDFDRPYDPEEEYDPAMGYGMVAPQSIENINADGPAVSVFVDDDVAYDPEDETIFADIQSDIVTKPPAPSQMSDAASCLTPVSTQAVTPTPTTTSAQTSSPAGVTQNLPTGTVVVSAATLTEQQRMLEELNKQIEEQKRQLKEQEEALRQQREAVGMFMAHFSVSDSLMSPPPKSLPPSQLSSLQSGIMQTESKPSESTEKSSNLTENEDSSILSQTVQIEDTAATPNLKNDTDTMTEQDEAQENVKESDKCSSAGEIEDSDVAYDPEDESLFNEIQEDVFQGSSSKTHDSSLSRIGHRASSKGTTLNSYHSRKRRLSPKRRSHRERDRHRSPSRKSQRHSPSHSQRRRERDRHRRSERDRSRHRARDQSERQGRHRKEHTARRHSHGRRRSPSSRKKESLSLSPKQQREPSPEDLTKSSLLVSIKNDPDGHHSKCDLVESPHKDFPPCSHELAHSVKLEISEPHTSQELQNNSVSDHDDMGRSSSTQVDKDSQQETLLKNKIESTIPLREIDPPIRDSPQSPDPEPQFVKPSSIEKSDFKTEEIRDPETCASVSVPPVKSENTCLPIGGQATVSNMLWPTVGGPVSNIRNLDFRALDLQGPGDRYQSMIDIGKQIQGESPGFKHPERLGQGVGHSNPATGPGPGSGPEVRNLGLHMKEPEYRGPHTYLRETGIRFPGPDMRSPLMQDINPSIWVPGPHMQDPALSSQGKCVRNLGTGMQGSEQNMRETGIQGVNPEVKGPGPEVIHSGSEMRGQMLVPAVTDSHLGGSSLQNDRRYQVMKDQSFDGLQVESRASDIIGRGRAQKDGGESPHTGGVRSAMRGGDVRDPDIKSPVSSFRGQRPSRYDNSPVLEERGPQKRGFQPHGRDADLSRAGVGRERSLDASVSSESTVLRADSLSPAMTDERWGPQKGQDVLMRGPPPNINYPSGRSNMLCIRQDISGPREHFRESRPDIGPERSVRGPDMRESETMHDLRGPDMTERRYIEFGQDVGGMGGSDTRGERGESHPRSSSRDMGEMGSKRRDADMQGRNIKGLFLERKNEQIDQEGSPMPDWRGPEPGLVGPTLKDQRIQNKGQGQYVRGPDWSGPGPDIKEDWGGTDRRGLGPVTRGPIIQDEWRACQPDRAGSSIKDIRHERRGPGGPDFMGPQPEGRGSDPMHNSTGPGRPDFRRPELERRAPTTDNLGPVRRGSEGPDFVGPGLERRGPPIEGPGPNRRGPPGPDVRAPWPDRRGPAMEGSGIDRQGPGGPDFRGPGPERRGPAMEGLGSERRGPGSQDFRVPWPERRGPDVGISGPDRRGPGGPSIEGSGADKQAPRGPDFRGPGPERTIFSVEHPGSDSRGPGYPDFRRSGPEMRGHTVDTKEPDRRGPGGLDLRGPGYERIGLSAHDQGPDRRGQVDQNTGGLDPGRKGPYMRGPELDFIGLGPEQTGPEGPGFHSRGQGGPDFRGAGPNFRGSPGGPQFRDPKSERRPPDMEGPDSDRSGPHFSGVRPERTITEGPWTERRGPRVPEFREPGWENRCMDIEGPGLNSQEPEGSGFREPWPERKGPDMEVTGTNWRKPGGPDFRGRGMRHKGPNIEGLRHRRDDWEGTDFRRSEPVQESPYIEGSRPDRTGRHLRGPGPLRRNTRGPGLEMSSLNRVDRWEGADFRDSAPAMYGAHTEEQWSDGREPKMETIGNERECSGDEWKRRGDRCPVPVHEGPDDQGQQHSRQCPPIEFRGPGSRGPKHMQERPNMHFPGSMRGPGDDWGESDCRGPGFVQDGPDMECSGSTRGGSGNEWRGPDRWGAGPNRRGQGHDKRGLGMRGPISDMRGGPVMGNDWRQPNSRGNMGGPDMEGPRAHRGGPDVINSCPNRRGFEMERIDRRGPDPGPDLRCPVPENRNSSTKGPGTGGRFSDCGGLRSESPGTDRQGFDDFRRERRGPDPCFDNLQNQQAVKPQKHRAALLPTPTGLIRFPNHIINSPDTFSSKRKPMGHPTDRGWTRGRPVSRERELVKGQRQEQEKSCVGKINTPVDRDKKEEGNETNKPGIHGACVETKSN